MEGVVSVLFSFLFRSISITSAGKVESLESNEEKKRPDNQKNKRTTRQNGEQQQQTETRSGQAHAQMKQCTRIKREKKQQQQITQ